MYINLKQQLIKLIIKEYMVNGSKYTMRSTFLGNICEELSKSTRKQENSFHNNSKNYEERCGQRASRFLEAQFTMVMRGPARLWSKDTLWHIMTATMIMQDKRGEDDQVR